MSKPTFEQFHVALMHDSERRRYGIPLDTIGAFQILRDERTSRTYYKAWTPTFSAARPRSRMSSAEQLRRTIIGWLMLLVILGVTAAVVLTAGDALMHLMNDGPTPGGFPVPSW